MKKSVLLLAICLTITFSAKAQIFEIDGNSESSLREEIQSGPKTPSFSSTQDSGPYSPLGGGAALLIGFGAAYLMAKRRRE